MREILLKGLVELKLDLNEQQIDKLLAYLALLVKWNKAYNLTAIREPEKMLTHHLLDSLAIAPYIKGDSILDVGTGAGLPGIPMAITYPEKQFTLLDSNGKKTRFVQQAKLELGLDNLQVAKTRVEELTLEGQHENGFDLITSRAFADLELMVKLTRHLLAPEGRMAAMKGPKAEEELAPIRDQVADLTTHTLNVPMLDGQRHLLVFGLKN